MFFSRFRKHGRLMVLLLVLPLLGGVVFYVYARPVFHSQSLIAIELPQAAADSDPRQNESRIQAAARELQAPHTAERAARRLGLKGTVREIASKYVFKQTWRSNADGTLDLDVWAVSSELAARWSKTLLEEFRIYDDGVRYRRLQEIIATYGKELRDVAEQLGEPLKPDLEIKDQNDVVRILAVLEKSAPAELIRVGQRLNEIGRVRVSLADPSLDVLARLALLQTLDSAPAEAPAWQELSKEQWRLTEEIDAMTRAVPPDQERIEPLTKQRADILAKLAAAYQALRARFDGEFQTLLERKTELEEKVPEPAKGKTPGGEIKQRAAVSTMSRTPWVQMAAEMQRKIAALENEGASGVPRLRLQSDAQFPEAPLSPNREKVGLIALLAGVALALGVPALLAAVGAIFSTTRRAENALGLRHLGVVPQTGGEGAADGKLAESFDAIRAKLITATGPHVMLVASALAQEGKTITAMQLAEASARAKRRTLLLDGDLRQGRVHRLFGYRRSPGLADVLLGAATADATCRPALQENLWVLPAGRRLENGAKLLGSEQFTELMTTLRKQFGCIIIDSPAVLGLSEASILQRQTDGVLLVVGSACARDKLETAHETLRVNGAKFLGFVTNDGAPARAHPRLHELVATV